MLDQRFLYEAPLMPQSPGLSQREHEAVILEHCVENLGKRSMTGGMGNARPAFKLGSTGKIQPVVIEVDNAFAARWVETIYP